MKTIDVMQIEMNVYGHYNEFEYIHDFLKFLWKIVYVKEVNLFWGGDVYLYKIDYYKFLLLVYLFD